MNVKGIFGTIGETLTGITTILGSLVFIGLVIGKVY